MGNFRVSSLQYFSPLLLLEFFSKLILIAFRLECHFYHKWMSTWMHLVLLFMTILGGARNAAIWNQSQLTRPWSAIFWLRQDWPGKMELQTARFSINISDKLNQLVSIVTRSWSLDWKSCWRFSDGCGRWNFQTHTERKAEVESVFPDLIVDASSGNSSHPCNSIVRQNNRFCWAQFSLGRLPFLRKEGEQGRKFIPEFDHGYENEMGGVWRGNSFGLQVFCSCIHLPNFGYTVHPNSIQKNRSPKISKQFFSSQSLYFFFGKKSRVGLGGPGVAWRKRPDNAPKRITWRFGLRDLHGLMLKGLVLDWIFTV